MLRAQDRILLDAFEWTVQPTDEGQKKNIEIELKYLGSKDVLRSRL